MSDGVGAGQGQGRSGAGGEGAGAWPGQPEAVALLPLMGAAVGQGPQVRAPKSGAPSV